MRLSVTIAAGLALVVALFASVAGGMPPTLACLWDYDTLKAEANGLPGIAEILTGRIERNPPRYYEMRLERVTRELAADPSRLDLYDDAGVACDRLGRSDDAIEWMAKKRRVLDALDATKPEVHEQEYRYFANLGTFHAHRWVRGGGPRDRLDDLKDAEREIARAIEINPDAHFGRERYQLAAIWWLNELPASNWGGQPTFLEVIFDPGGKATSRAQVSLSKPELDKAITGVSGLMVLGNAWESVDVTWALGMLLKARGDASLAYLAELRVKELIGSGKASFHPHFRSDADMRSPLGLGGSPTESSARDIDDYFVRARQAASQWAEDRDGYMEERLARGEHPDSTPTFWSEWKDEPKPTPLPNNEVMRPEAKIGIALSVAVVIFGLVIWRYVSWAVRLFRS